MAPAASSASAAHDLTCANGSPPITRAQPAMYAAHQPLSQDSADAAPGETGWTAALANASPSSGIIAGAASAFAGTERSGSAWNWIHRIGAVATPHATETASAPRSQRGS